MNRKELEDAGMVYRQAEPPRMPLIIKYSGVFLNREERDKIREEIKEAAGCKAVLLPPGFDLATASGRWIDRTDKEYVGGGYTECSVCGDRLSWGAYFEANNFRYCPKCGARMHPDKHIFEEMRDEPEADDSDWYINEDREDLE